MTLMCRIRFGLYILANVTLSLTNEKATSTQSFKYVEHISNIQGWLSYVLLVFPALGRFKCVCIYPCL